MSVAKTTIAHTVDTSSNSSFKFKPLSENTKELRRLENRDKVRNFQKQATSLAKAGTLKNKRKKK